MATFDDTKDSPASTFVQILRSDREERIVATALSVLNNLDQNKPGIGPIWQQSCWVISAYLKGHPVY